MDELKEKHGCYVKYIKCDNAGKNLAFEMDAIRKGLAYISSTLHQAHLNKIAEVKENLPLYFEGRMQF